ncbi:MAG: MMPL family transporter [Deltaproteobacteria bacterium]|nr:MMPL family transporter [Deltaproteobacteria bacterium]
MIDRLARFFARRRVAWVTVVVVLGVAGVCAWLSSRVVREDDLLAFLSQRDPDIQRFRELGKRFGGLDVALVGVESPEVFSTPFLTRLKAATREVKETAGVDHALSLANVVDFVPDPVKGGIVTSELLGEVPATPEALAAFRRRVMVADYLVGNVISPRGDAVLIYCFLRPGVDQRRVAEQIRERVTRVFSTERKYWGGTPFIHSYIYDLIQKDLRRLMPWAVAAMLLVSMLAFRDWLGTLITIFSAAFGVIFALGLMVAFDVKLNLVLSSMPVILFAVGSAYGVHVLGSYYRYAQHQAPEDAVQSAMRAVGVPVITAGLTTVLGILSFLSMDLRPMRAFGLFTALGVTASLLLALTFVPAVLVLARPKKRRDPSTSFGQRTLERITLVCGRQRGLVAGGVLLFAALGGYLVSRVNTHVEISYLFNPGSSPDQAEQFLRRHFGGSQFLQVELSGDMTNPWVLRELQWLGDRLVLRSDVSQVMHIGDAMARGNEAMDSQRRLPLDRNKLQLLTALIGADPALAQLVTADRRRALLQVKLSGYRAEKLEQVLSDYERTIPALLPAAYAVESVTGPRGGEARERRRLMVRDRLLAVLKGAGVPLSPVQEEQLLAVLPPREVKLSPESVLPALVAFLRSEECAVPLPPASGSDDAARDVAQAAATLGPAPSREALVRALRRVLEPLSLAQQAEDLALSLETPLAEQWRGARAKAQVDAFLRLLDAGLPSGPEGPLAREHLAAALLDFEAPQVLLPARGAAAGTLQVAVSGVPVLHRSMSRSAVRNQLMSLGSALALVVVLMTLMFRSVSTGLLLSVPTLVTLIAIYGGMGLFGIHLDIGTAMLASLTLGQGVDYAVHLLGAWKAREDEPMSAAASRAVRHAGPSIIANALMVGAGFGVLTLGEAVPVRNLGGLTAAAMLVAAVATFLTIPALARRSRYELGARERRLARLPDADLAPLEDR